MNSSTQNGGYPVAPAGAAISTLGTGTASATSASTRTSFAHDAGMRS